MEELLQGYKISYVAYYAELNQKIYCCFSEYSLENQILVEVRIVRDYAAYKTLINVLWKRETIASYTIWEKATVDDPSLRNAAMLVDIMGLIETTDIEKLPMVLDNLNLAGIQPAQKAICAKFELYITKIQIR